MSARRVEEFLALLYVDPETRRRFVAEPRECARRAGLPERDVDSVAGLDPCDLDLAARSFAAKRATLDKARRGGWLGWMSRLLRRRP